MEPAVLDEQCLAGHMGAEQGAFGQVPVSVMLANSCCSPVLNPHCIGHIQIVCSCIGLCKNEQISLM